MQSNDIRDMNELNEQMIKNAISLAGKIKAKSILIHIDPLDDLNYSGKIPKRVKLFLISKKKKLDAQTETKSPLAQHARALLTIPKINMTRVGITKVAATLALSHEHIKQGDKLIVLVGRQDVGLLDHLQMIDTSKESELLTSRAVTGLAASVQPEVFQAVLNLAIELGDKGREGKPIGTIFVVGDHERVLQLSKQMIINPFKGYDEDERNILHPSLKETIREFAAMDGAFIISESGIVITAGRHLGAASEDASVVRGLGARHIAAAGITSLTKAVAFVISESSGDVRIFNSGKVIMEVEKAPTRR